MLPAYLIADVDDTLTVGGSLHPRVLEAIARAARAGIEVILDTGRSAGWGAALLAYLDGVSAVIVENGGAWFDKRGRRGHKSGSDRAVAGEVPVQFRLPPPAELRDRLRDLCDRVAAQAGLA